MSTSVTTPVAVRIERAFPTVVTCEDPGVDLARWCAANRPLVEALLLEHGAVLFRDFAVPTIPDFERAAKATWGDLYADYGDLPRNGVGGKIYESTPYPIDQMILFHNESAHLASWPLRIAFHCVTPALAGGCTPILDTRLALRELDSAIVDAFRKRGLLYVRNFSAGIDPTWQQFFHSTDRAVVEAACRAAGSDFAWRGDSLRVSRRAPAVATHPATGEEIFFNQIQHHHIACVDEETQDGLRALFDDDELPRHVYFGDGSPIPDAVMRHVGETFERICVRFAWQKGDAIVLDNMLAAHARDPFEGPRHIVVAMGRMVGEGGDLT